MISTLQAVWDISFVLSSPNCIFLLGSQCSNITTQITISLIKTSWFDTKWRCTEEYRGTPCFRGFSYILTFFGELVKFLALKLNTQTGALRRQSWSWNASPWSCAKLGLAKKLICKHFLFWWNNGTLNQDFLTWCWKEWFAFTFWLLTFLSCACIILPCLVNLEKKIQTPTYTTYDKSETIMES